MQEFVLEVIRGFNFEVKRVEWIKGERFLPVFSRFASSVTHLCGPFLPQRDPESDTRSNFLRPAQNKETKPAREALLPRAHKAMEKAPCSSKYSLPPSFGWPTATFTTPLHLLPIAGVGQGQGVFVSKHSTAISKRGNLP